MHKITLYSIATIRYVTIQYDRGV